MREKTPPTGKRRPGLRRLVSAILLLGLLTALTKPGRRATRLLARWVDARAEHFTEPGSTTYAQFIAPVMGRMYGRVADDAARELAARGPKRHATIVDLGCGPGDLAVTISRRLRDARIVGLDLSPSMLLWAGRHATTDGRLKFVVGDAADLPFGDASVDLVVSTLSLHHWYEPAEVFAEIARVLRPGGVALLYDLSLLAPTPSEMAEIARGAGLDPRQISRRRAGEGLTSCFFTRFSLEAEASA